MRPNYTQGTSDWINRVNNVRRTGYKQDFVRAQWDMRRDVRMRNSIWDKERTIVNKVLDGITSWKPARSIGKNPWIAGGIMAGAGMMASAAGIPGKLVRFKRQEKIGSLSGGAGYISWSKSSGMPSNHLSTQGLGLALSNLRHTSSI